MLSVYLPNCPPDIFFDHMCVLVTAEIVVGVGSNVNLGARPYKNMVGEAYVIRNRVPFAHFVH